MRKVNPIKDFIFPRFGSLIVISPADPEYRKSGRIEPASLCRCDCGGLKIRRNAQLLRGKAKTCGCYREFHGLTRKPIYNVWCAMRERCSNPNNKSYSDYGGAGITVCEAWKSSFLQFYADMGDKPSKRHSIDREDGAKGYSPENCRWATPKEQARNTKRNHYLEYNGERLIIAEWAERTGLSNGLILWRLKAGWSVERIITTPADRRFDKRPQVPWNLED